MSAKHPIIAITGSSGAGTTSVTRRSSTSSAARASTRRDRRGRRFHRYDRKEMRARLEQRPSSERRTHFSHFGPEANLFEELEQLFRDYGETGTGQIAQVPARRRGGRALRAGAGHLHAVGGHPAGHRPAVLRRPARRRGHRRGRRRAARRPADRRRADHQPRMDPEAAPRQDHARLLARGGDRHDPAPHARLRELHLPAVLAHARELPARADGGHVESVHRPRHPDRGREHAW